MVQQVTLLPHCNVCD